MAKSPRRVGVPPTTKDLENFSPHVNGWFNEVTGRMGVYVGTSDPTTNVCPEGQWIVYNNTTSSEIRIWTNVAGVMKKSAAFT